MYLYRYLVLIDLLAHLVFGFSVPGTRYPLLLSLFNIFKVKTSFHFSL